MIDHDVQFVIIGGHAVNAHGFLRSTEDVDVVWIKDDRSTIKLLQVLEAVNAFWIGNEIDPQTGIERIYPVNLEYIRSRGLMMLGTDHGYIDLFDHVPGVPEITVRELIEQSVTIAGRPYASIPHLRRMKAAIGRPIDLLDLQRLPPGDSFS